MANADRMRGRLRELGRAGRQPAPAELESRVAARMRAEGPALVRRSHQRRTLLRAAAVALPLTLAGVWLGRQELPPPRPPERAQAPAAVNASTATAKPMPPACATRPLASVELRVPADVRRHVELGDRGRIALEPSSEAQFVADDPCRLLLRLARGRVTIHAANLFDGELRVSAGTTDVVVHGTTFAVERERERITVLVDEGAVRVSSRGRALAPLLRAGEALRVEAERPSAVQTLSDTERLQLQAALAPVRPSGEGAPTAEPVTSGQARPSRGAPADSAAKLVIRADALWQSGERAGARARYREAGAATGPTAEAAWLALARRELSVGNARAALETVARYRARFPAGELAAEAAGIEFRVALAQRDVRRAERLARKLVERYPQTPQAEAAARWRREQTTAP